MSVKYTKDHEWVRVDGNVITVGITDHAQAQLGDLVYVELGEVGRQLARGESFAVVESVKAASDVYAPCAGEIVARNEALNDAPETVNSDPQGEGWLIKIAIADAAELNELLSESDYKTLIA